MNRILKNVLVTGGAGFIGSNFIGHFLRDARFRGRVVNLDSLTYAGNLENLSSVDKEFGGERYAFEKGDICDRAAVASVFDRFQIDTVVHFAAESHVDRSISGPEAFVRTNVMGTFTLLDVARERWAGEQRTLFHHVSTDEVYGSLGDSGRFTESSAYAPRSPYSASKAASDHLAMAYHATYGLPVTLSNCSNNYGPYQFPEKLIPLMILNTGAGKGLPIYGDGRNVRDWLFVEDHVSAISLILRESAPGETWNVGGETELENLEVVNLLCEKCALVDGHPLGDYKRLITFVKDRPGHDRRYAIDCSKIKVRLGWKQSVDFGSGLERTVRWYRDHAQWIERVRSGAYREWLEKNYAAR